MTHAELWTILHALQNPENGVHYCRSCRAGTSNGWKHEEYCRINKLEIEVSKAREIVTRAIESYVKTDPYEGENMIKCECATWATDYDFKHCLSAKYRVEVIADNSGQWWCGNGLKFDTYAEAKEYAIDLFARWTAVREWRVVLV